MPAERLPRRQSESGRLQTAFPLTGGQAFDTATHPRC